MTQWNMMAQRYARHRSLNATWATHDKKINDRVNASEGDVRRTDQITVYGNHMNLQDEFWLQQAEYRPVSQIR